MSPNWLLIWTVAISCGFTVLSLLRHRVRSPLRYFPAILVGGALLFFYRRDAETAGYYAGSVWFVLMLLPGLASQSANSLLGSRRFQEAYVMSWVAWLLHPSSGTRDQPRLVQALSLLHQNKSESAVAILESLCHKKTSSGRAAFVILTRLRGDWQRFVDSIHNSPNAGQQLSDPLISNIYLQALGELGQTEMLVQNFAHGMLRRKRGTSAVMLNISRMKVAAFCGRTHLVATILDSTLGHFDSETRRFWIATAMQAAGRVDDARSIFEELQSSRDRQIAVASSQRIVLPVRVVSHLSPEMSKVMDETEAALEHETNFALISIPATTKHVATWGLVAVLVLVFLAEMLNGNVGRIVWESTTLSSNEKLELMLENTMDNANLIDMGALVLPVSSNSDRYWRVFRAAFLHFGLLHLSMNVAGLIFFGQRLEEAWGAVTTCLAYLLCAILSIYLLTVLPLGATADEPYVLVGASGGVMGLIGCLLGYLGWGQLVLRNRLVASEFNLLFLIIIFQMVFDQMTPNVSSECHLLGMLIGVACGFLVGVTRHQLSARRRTPEQKLQPVSP